MRLDRREFLSVGLGGAFISCCGVDKTAMTAAQSSQPKRLLIDTDPGVDDAVAIFLALKSSEVRVEALTVVAGNVETDLGSRNARAILEVARRADIPVAIGANKPLLRPLHNARYAHGNDGFGGVAVPEPKMSALREHAVDFIIERVKANPHELDIVAIGPLTNIALALLKDPSIAPLIRALTFMGGTILSNGNSTPVSTFNVWCDPEAAKIVFNSGIPHIAMVGTDVTTKVTFSVGDCEKLEASGTPEALLAAKFTRFRLSHFVDTYATHAEPAVGFNDLGTMAYVVKPSLFTSEPMLVDVETKGELTSGMTVANRRKVQAKYDAKGELTGTEPIKPNVDVATGIQAQDVKKMFMDRIMAS